MEKRTKILIGIGAVILIGAIVTGIILYLKRKNESSENPEEGGTNLAKTNGRPSYTPNHASGYSKSDIEAMQNKMLSLARNNGMMGVVNDINSHGGVDGIAGDAFKRSLEALTTIGLISSLEDLYRKSVSSGSNPGGGSYLPNDYGLYIT